MRKLRTARIDGEVNKTAQMQKGSFECIRSLIFPSKDFNSGDELIVGSRASLRDIYCIMGLGIEGEGEATYAGTVTRYLRKNVAQTRIQTFSRAFL
jgi:hypothetical protein